VAIRGYMACSLDGLAADAQGGADWLAPYAAADAALVERFERVDTVVMGRRTYDELPQLGAGWPYPGKRGWVVTSGPGTSRYGEAAFWRRGLAELVAHLRATPGGEVRVVGGPTLLAGWLAAGGLDGLDLFVVPLLLGGGRPLFPHDAAAPRTLVLRQAEALEGGLVRLDYDLGPVVKRRRRAA